MTDKRALYKTAVVARHIFTNNGDADLPAGAFVGIAFIGEHRNQLYRREEAVYAVTHDGKFWGHLYANCLRDFVL
jgi:hypothetical protein